MTKNNVQSFIENSPSLLLEAAKRSALEIALTDALERMYQSEMVETEMHYLQIAECGFHYCESRNYEFDENGYDWQTANEWKAERLLELLPDNYLK